MMKWEWKLSSAAGHGHPTTSIAFYIRACSKKRGKTVFRIPIPQAKIAEAKKIAEAIVTCLNDAQIFL